MNRATLSAAQRIATVDDTTFAERVLAASGPIVVEFMSYGCTHCRALEPALETVARRLGSSVRVVRVNVALDSELANQYNVEATPTLIMFLDATEVARVEGPPPNVPSLTTAMTRPFAAVRSSQ